MLSVIKETHEWGLKKNLPTPFPLYALFFPFQNETVHFLDAVFLFPQTAENTTGSQHNDKQ